MKGYTDLPFQIVITGELKGGEYAAYRALTDKVDEVDVESVIEGAGQEKDDEKPCCFEPGFCYSPYGLGTIQK